MSDFNNIKEGDKVMIQAFVSYGWNCCKRFWTTAKVSRTTKTQLLVGDRRFKKDTGCEIGGRYWDIVEPLNSKPDETKAMNDFIRIVKSWRELKNKVSEVKLPEIESVSIDKLNKLHGLLDLYILELE